MIERVVIDLPEAEAKCIREVVAAGEYKSAADVVRAALHLWETSRAAADIDPEVLRDHWARGKASGLFGSIDADDFLARKRAEKARAV